jgi:hypothetical protein
VAAEEQFAANRLRAREPRVVPAWVRVLERHRRLVLVGEAALLLLLWYVGVLSVVSLGVGFLLGSGFKLMRRSWMPPPGAGVSS